MIVPSFCECVGVDYPGVTLVVQVRVRHWCLASFALSRKLVSHFVQHISTLVWVGDATASAFLDSFLFLTIVEIVIANSLLKYRSMELPRPWRDTYTDSVGRDELVTREKGC